MHAVSIITATLNRPSLKDACLSVDNQTFQNWHHYVIGDGVAPAEFAHPRRTTIGFTTHIGASEPAADMPYGTPNPVFRWALSHLKLGQLVCLLDDDNVYKPEFLKVMSETLLESNAGIAICALEDLRNSAVHDGYPELERCDMSGFLVYACIAQQVGFPNEYPNRDAISDFDFIKQCAEEYGWVRVPDKLVIYGYARRLYPNMV
jgi:glycosyltransferase involved in cell wall biosynthesis